jgi:hypothetical protein
MPDYRRFLLRQKEKQGHRPAAMRGFSPGRCRTDPTAEPGRDAPGRQADAIMPEIPDKHL